MQLNCDAEKFEVFFFSTTELLVASIFDSERDRSNPFNYYLPLLLPMLPMLPKLKLPPLLPRSHEIDVDNEMKIEIIRRNWLYNDCSLIVTKERRRCDTNCTHNPNNMLTVI